MQVIIERTLGGYTVSKASFYETAYNVDYTPFNTGLNIFGQRLADIMPREVLTRTYYQTRLRADVALSHQLKTIDLARAWALSKGLDVLDKSIHSIIERV